MRGMEQSVGKAWAAPHDSPAETPEVLYFRYLAYRRRHADRLVRLIPREAVRELYGKARNWALEEGVHDSRDPMATLTRFAEHLLPLPPFEVWLVDRASHPIRHIEDSSETSPVSPPAEPAKIEERRFDYEGRTWVASLHVFAVGTRWRGFLRFRQSGHSRRYHTAHIFLEKTAREVRRSFRGFDGAALGAFLRSVLP